MAKNKNSYQKAAQKKALSGTSSGEPIKEAATELGKDIVVGVIGGGVAGAALGRLSFLVGAAVSGVGHFSKSRLTSALGLGMMASGTYQTMSGMNGTPTEGLEGVKERLLLLKEDMKRRVFLDKVLKSKTSKTEENGTNGLGQVQYFLYPNSQESMGELDMSALDKYHEQIQNHATNGLDGAVDMVEPSEKIY